MRPKGKLFALVVMFAAVGLITASGAFTTVEADRTADVNVAGDSSALLALEAGADNPEYVTGGSTDEIEFDISEGTQGSSNAEINLNATTEINGTINVTNNGQSTVNLGVSVSGENSGLVEFYEKGDRSSDLTQSNTVELTSGETVELDVVIDTTQDPSLSNNVEIIDTITFEANAV